MDWHGFLSWVLNLVDAKIGLDEEVRVAFPSITKALNDVFVKTPKR